MRNIHLQHKQHNLNNKHNIYKTMERIETKLKFSVSGKTGQVVGFVKRDPSGKIYGVKENDQIPKSIVVLADNIKDRIEIGVLYNVELKPMKSKLGYVATQATPTQFEAKLRTFSVPKTLYQIRISFGNKTITYDPLDGKDERYSTIECIVRTLKNRKDIGNKEEIIKTFQEEAQELFKKIVEDGYKLQ